MIPAAPLALGVGSPPTGPEKSGSVGSMSKKNPISEPLIREIRRAMAGGLTQSELARRAGVPAPNLSRFLTGQKTITIETADRIAVALFQEPQ